MHNGTHGAEGSSGLSPGAGPPATGVAVGAYATLGGDCALKVAVFVKWEKVAIVVEVGAVDREAGFLAMNEQIGKGTWTRIVVGEGPCRERSFEKDVKRKMIVVVGEQEVARWCSGDLRLIREAEAVWYTLSADWARTARDTALV